MKFWDSSALIPLLIYERETSRAQDIFQKDPHIIVWTFSTIECFSALYRREREGKISVDEIQKFRSQLSAFEQSWTEITAIEAVKNKAQRLLAVHKLRAADALQLAAALVIYEENKLFSDFVTFDENLSLAAAKEGFKVSTLKK